MKIVIQNYEFDFDTGCRLLKLKSDVCPFEELSDFWEDIKPITFKEIAKFQNLEMRRVGVDILGLERLINEVNPTLISKETISKKTQWVGENGDTITHIFEDTYELFEVDGSYFSEGLDSWRKMANCHYVRCKDTSTDRTYLIWIDKSSVKNTNGIGYTDDRDINSIMAIAWTIQTNVPKGNIEKIIRQGDCILIKPKGKYKPLDRERHLTEEEYRTLLVSES
jgi:hypothetical protein